MAITKDNIIFVYNLNDSNSVELAAYYALKHNMRTECADPSNSSGVLSGIEWEVNGQIVGIGMDLYDEVLASETDFNVQLLNPLKYALLNSSEMLSMTIYGIVLGYNIPGGFRDGDDIISSTSRISRILSTFDKKIKNKLYNRSVFSRFDEEDASICLLCSRIDAPTYLMAKSIIDNANMLQNNMVVTGKFYVDPYSDKVGTLAENYTNQIISFQDNILPLLNLDTWETIFMDPYIDSLIPYVVDDSFVWSWFSDRGTSSFFKNSASQRVFFYNADYDGAYTVKDEEGKRWCYLALSNNYVSTAGSMSNPGLDGFLDPVAFYNALLKGATIGEAFIFSSPYLDWTVTLFGDPLSSCIFPSNEITGEEVTDEFSAWLQMSKDLSRSIAHLYKKGLEIAEARDIILDLDSPEADQLVDLFYALNDLENHCNTAAMNSQFSNVVSVFLNFPQKRYSNLSVYSVSESLNTYLSEHEFKISTLLTDRIGITGKIDSENLLTEGWWQFEFTLVDNDSDYVSYHFVLEVSDSNSFDTLLLTTDSFSITNWTYEKDKDQFVVMPFDGVPSSHMGRKIRYESQYDILLGTNEYLTRGETYYFRITAYNADTDETYPSVIYSDIIYS